MKYYEIAAIHSRRCTFSAIATIVLMVAVVEAVLCGWIFVACVLWLLLMLAAVSAFHHAIEKGRNLQLSSFYDDWAPYKEFPTLTKHQDMK